MSTATAVKHELELFVDFGGVSIGDETASVGVKVDRQDLDLDAADEFLSGKRLEGEISIGNSNEDPQLFEHGDKKPELSTSFDVKGFRVTSKEIGFRLTFALSTVDVEVLSHFAKRSGKISVDNLGEIPDDKGEDLEDVMPSPTGNPLPGVDKGSAMPLGSLERSKLKGLIGRDPGVENSLTESKIAVLISHVDVQVGGASIGHFESIMRGNEYWHRNIKGFGEQWIERVINALMVFRGKFPHPDDLEDEEENDDDDPSQGNEESQDAFDQEDDADE